MIPYTKKPELLFSIGDPCWAKEHPEYGKGVVAARWGSWRVCMECGQATLAEVKPAPLRKRRKNSKKRRKRLPVVRPVRHLKKPHQCTACHQIIHKVRTISGQEILDCKFGHEVLPLHQSRLSEKPILQVVK